MQVAATLREASKYSQDWDARDAQEVAAARAQGANQGALVDRNERHAEFPHRKAEQKQVEAFGEPHAPDLVEAAALAQAEVPDHHLPAVLGVPAAVTLMPARKGNTRRVRCCRVVKVSRLHAVHVRLLLLVFTTQGNYRSL